MDSVTLDKLDSELRTLATDELTVDAANDGAVSVLLTLLAVVATTCELYPLCAFK